MGTTTFYLRMNDLKKPFASMTKEELQALDNLSPYKKDEYVGGWRVPMELHNGNVYPLIFWKGRLMKLEEAPDLLTRKYYNKYTGKTMNVYEWTLLKRMITRNLEYLDKQFKRLQRKIKSAENLGDPKNPKK